MQPEAPPDPRRWWTLGVLCLLADRDQPRQHDPQRRAADARSATSAPRLASCSGSSTPTCSSSPACCSPPAALGDRFGRRRALTVGLLVFGARLGARPRSADSADDADRDAGADGRRRRVHHALDAVDPHQRLPRRASGRRRSASGPASSGLGIAIGPVSRRLARRARRVELRSSSSTSRSSPSRSSPAAGSCRSPATPRAPPLDLARLRALDRRPHRARVGDHRGARRAAGPTP